MTHYYTEQDGRPMRVDPGAVNLGLAVDVERRDGSRFLVVPVIKAADAMDFAGFHARYEELVDRARTNKLGPDDFVGATISLTNPGTLGTDLQRAAADAEARAPSWRPGTIRDVGQARMMTISSTYDHRIIQGAESGTFLRRIDAALNGEGDFYAGVFAALGVALRRRRRRRPHRLDAGQPAAYEDLKAVAAGMALVKAYRHFGHLAAHLDPLGSEPPGDPSLDPGAARPRRARTWPASRPS